MIDTHTHLNLEPLFQDYQTIYQQAYDAGVTQMIVPGVNLTSSQKAIKLAQELPGVFAGVGYHPDEAEQLLSTTDTQTIYQELLTLAQQKPVVAIGECGLDYFRLSDDGFEQKNTKAAQKKLFKLHIRISKELNKPLLIHVRDAHADAIKILTATKPKAVLHCFSGDEAYLKSALDLGLYISLAGNITFKNAMALQRLLPLIPQDRLLLETDAPFLNPTRGQWPNTPSNIRLTYTFVAQSLGLSASNLSDLIHHNTSEFLGTD